MIGENGRPAYQVRAASRVSTSDGVDVPMLEPREGRPQGKRAATISTANLDDAILPPRSGETRPSYDASRARAQAAWAREARRDALEDPAHHPGPADPHCCGRLGFPELAACIKLRLVCGESLCARAQLVEGREATA